jgi:hypothetical protein
LFERRNLRIDGRKNVRECHAGNISPSQLAGPWPESVTGLGPLSFQASPTVNVLIEGAATPLAISRNVWGRCGAFVPLGWVEEDAQRPQRGRVAPSQRRRKMVCGLDIVFEAVMRSRRTQ